MARAALEQAIQVDPQSAAVHEALGYCLFRTRDFEAAEQSYKQALAYDWRLSRAHAGLGSINMMMYLKDESLTGRRDRALEHWHRSLELNPDQPRISKLIAQYAPQKREPDEALLTVPAAP